MTAIDDASVFVLAGDVPLLRRETLARLYARHRESDAAATILSFRLQNPGAYGRVVRGAEGRVAKIVEARDANADELAITEVNASVYVFAEGKLRDALKRLRPENTQGELYLTDCVEHLVAAGERVEAVVADDPAEASGVNTVAELAEVERILYRRRAEGFQLGGVSIERPDTVLIGPDVRVAAGAILRAFTILEGRSSIAEGAAVGPFCRIENSDLGAGSTILDSCLIRDSKIGAGATIGPFAHIRPESVVGENAKVGNFVELKKTSLGAGSKAPHLSYLGDATIGEKVNLGAGTITCNYDGVKKSPTVIEEGAFVGSNAILVAPVAIGRGAYVAAGSVITKDVPAGALGVGRARQENKAGWASRRPRKA